MDDKPISKPKVRSLKDIIVAVGLVVALLVLTWHTASAGFAGLLTAYAAQTKNLDAANLATRVKSGDPDSHYVRGTVLEARNEMGSAADAYNQAVLRRPDHCLSWLSLARTRELNGQTNEAVIAARQSVLLAPYYAPPHWQLGNTLLRAGQREEAFKELRLAADSNPTLLPSVIDLAWRVSGGNIQFLEQAIQPKTPEAFQTLGRYLRQQGDLTSALAIYMSARGNAPAGEYGANLAALIAAKRFHEAFRLWLEGHPESKAGTLTDAGFEEERDLLETGFGWRMNANVQGIRLSLDSAEPKQGRLSLRVDFDGNSDPALPVLSQLVLVEPHTKYRLTFWARTDGIKSGGLPMVVAVDASTNSVLGQSEELPNATNGWRGYNIDFNSGGASALQINIQRKSCAEPACPIFGRLWLDNLWLQKV